MMRFLILMLTFVMPLAYAGEAILSWTLPTDSEVCSTNPAVPDIANTQVWELVETTGPADTTVTLTGLEPGDYTYVTSVVSTTGEVSRFSGTASKTIDSIVVNDDKAYTVVQSGGNFVAFIIGTVPVDTVCDANSMVRGLFNFLPFTGYGVPVTDVTITGDTEPVMVVATCH